MEQQNSPMDINARINEYKDVITHFSALLEEENKALRAYDVETVNSMLEQKTKLVASYRAMVAYFIKNQDEFKKADTACRQTLKEISEKLNALMVENDTLLKTKMTTSKMIMDSIVRFAKSSLSSNSTSYGAEGKYSPLDNAQNALTVNRTL